MKSNLKAILCYGLAIVAMIAVIAMVYRGTTDGKEPLSDGKILEYFYNEEVATYTLDYNKGTLTFCLFVKDEAGNLLDVDGNTVTLDVITDEDGNTTYKLPADAKQLKLSEEQTYKLADITTTRREIMAVVDRQMQEGVGVAILSDYQFSPANTYPWWVSLLPGLILIVVIVLLYFFAMKKMMQGGGPGGTKMSGFGKAHVKMPTDDKNKITFRDVAGADEEKEELVEIVDYLKSPTKFARLGARIPHGVLLMGPPGTGKTLLAKAVAGEAGVPFFSISGSDFVEMYVGVGASRVRDLFDTARKAGSAIIFIDEIDAVGRQRGTGLGGGHDEREQTLNQLLVEMDGFGSHEGIVVIAATNRADVLDPALLRPGRFDRQIQVNRPNIKGREDILKVHARNKPLEPGVDLAKVARITVGFTGADLANLLNEAALLAARRGKSLIGMDEIEEANNKITMGPRKKTWVMSDEEKKLTAYHETGHAIVGKLTGQDPVHLITIVPTGRGAGGYTSFRPEADSYYDHKNKLKGYIAMALAGRAAEEIIFGDVTSGAFSDIKSATSVAKHMVMQLGMSDKLGPRRFGTDQNEVFLGRDFSSNSDYSEAMAAVIDEEIHAIIAEAYETAKRLLLENITKLHFIAEYLLAHEDMDGDQFKAVMENEVVTVEMIEEIAEEKARQSKVANEERAKAEADRKAKAAKEAEAAEADKANETEKADENPFEYNRNNGENPFEYNRPQDDADDKNDKKH